MKSDRKGAAGEQKNSSSVKQVENTEFQYTPGVEIKIIVAVIFLISFGLIMIFSASSYTSSISADCNYDSMYYLKKQAFFSAGGLLVLFVVNLIPYKLFGKCAYVAYVVSLALIGLLKTSLGVESGGATRWIRLGFINLQVADVTRICMIIYMAYYVNKHWKDLQSMWYVFYLWVIVGVQAILVLFISSNLSSCLILLMMVFVLTWLVSKKSILHIVTMLTGGSVAVAALLWMKEHLPLESEMDNYKYQIQRIFAWIDTERYASSVGYQPLQSLYAIGSGGLWGKGLGNGTQKLSKIPEAQNDMIFSIICEELGIVGVIILFAMYGYLLYQMYIVVKESRNLYGSITVIGVMLHLTFQIIVNVCVSVNFFPNTGVSLPFVSSGGSAIICTLGEIGMVIGIRRQQYNRRYSNIK